MTGEHLWYGLDHQPIDMHEAEALLADHEARRVALDKLGDYTVSTIFLVLDHGWEPGTPPVLYETMVMAPEPEDEFVRRYYTRAQAVSGHDQLAAEVRERLSSRRSR